MAVVNDMVAFVLGARLQGDARPALEILARAGQWRGRDVVMHVEEVERQVRAHRDKKLLSR